MIGVVGADGDTLLAALRAAGATAEARSPDHVVECELVIAVGLEALGAVMATDQDTPVLPVACSRGTRDAELDRVVDAADRLASGDIPVVAHPRFAVTVDGERRRHGVLDVVLRTTEPARISEYAVTAGDDADRFRADGVAVTTPLGSTGYARAAGGPVLDPASGCVAVVPIAAFALGANTRVVPLDRGVALSVARDEAAVTLDVDGLGAGPVPPDAPVRITADGTVGIAVLRGA